MHGDQYLTEQRYDQMEPALEIICRDVLALGLRCGRSKSNRPEPVRIHFCADHGTYALPTTWCCFARREQIARRHGYHATFMCRPKLPNLFASRLAPASIAGSRANDENAFMAGDKGEALSPFGKDYLAGLLEHARASTVFTTPTING